MQASPPLDMYDLDLVELQRSLATDFTKGLTTREASKRLSQYGLNKIEQTKDTAVFALILRQFKSPLVLLLFFAVSLSFAYAKWGDGIAILCVLIINAFIGFLMEFQAERSMNALRRLTTTFTKVIRDESVQKIPTIEIVPGDLLFVEAGDCIAADARICNAFDLQVDESTMTGESTPREKLVTELSQNTHLAGRDNMVYKGTFVTRGNGKAIVVATGMATELGKIALLVQTAKDSTTPIEKKLEQLSKKLIWITLLLALAILVTGVMKGRNLFDMINMSIALFVAAVPEGLPIVATTALAHGMIKMAKKNVIVKKLAAVETLGGTNVICTDKTGTLTHNKIKVSHILTTDFHSLNDRKRTRSANYVFEAFVLCNNAHISNNQGRKSDIGDPLEVGLLRFAENQHIDVEALRRKFPKFLEEPFKSETKIMATLHHAPDGAVLFAKGGSETIISMCSFYLDGNTRKEFSTTLKNQWLRKSEKEASEGLKVIAFALKTSTDQQRPLDLTGLTFIGIAGLNDPPRTDVAEAIRLCHSAGIRVVMVTGDHPSTARKIAQQIGILSGATDTVIEGSSMPSFEQLTMKQKSEWRSAPVFARVNPIQKLDLVRVLQENDSIVAMTGDGVNDAPALKTADIGIAMGLRGTDVAKEVADMVLKDDSFSSIVVAIKEGRIIFENIRKSLMYLLSSNLSEIVVIAALYITGSPLTLIPLQILFINLLSDVFPALALGFSKGSDNIMDRSPRDSKKPILSNLQWMSIIVYAIVLASSVLLTSWFTLGDNPNEFDIAKASTVLFYTLILAQLIHVFSVGEHRQLFLKTDIFRNHYVWAGLLVSAGLAIGVYFIPTVKELMHLATLDSGSLIVIGGCSLISLAIIQVLKNLHFIH